MNTQTLKTVVLVGNPNVGKSSLFYRLTGTHVITGNFPGTTLSVTRGTLVTSGRNKSGSAYEIIDIPGIYSLTETTTAVTNGALFIIKQADIIINVIDATQLKRNLYLHEQLKTLKKPIIIGLNIYDEAGYHGITINTTLLAQRLACPVIPTVGITGNGIGLLIKTLETIACTYTAVKETSLQPNWHTITEHVAAVQTVHKRSKKLSEYLTTLSVHPVWGTLLATGVFSTTLVVLFGLSSSLESSVEYLFNLVLNGPLTMLNTALAPIPFLQQFLIGTIKHGTIDFNNAMGILTTGIYIPLGQVAPPVIAFYATMGLLEDSGYLPRIAYVADTLMHRYALHGAAIIPMLMGAGCNVTGIIGTRILENKQQRIIAATLIAITVPCASQTGFIVAMTSKMGATLTGFLILTLIGICHLLGLILGVSKRNNYQELIMEMPPLRLPRLKPSFRKLVHRIKNFLSDAIPITIVGIALVLLLTQSGILQTLAHTLFGWTRTAWGLPQQIVPALCMGLFRKEIALTFLRALPDLTAAQSFTATLILTLWFPCVSVYAILYKEFGFKTVCFMTAGMFLVSGSAGVIAHMLFTTFGG
jgi:ferrous iron transport protein B